jgi:uncharacterized surface protein with fasciclin (FAS1) repeats
MAATNVYADPGSERAAGARGATKDVVATAVEAGHFKTLVRALEAAGLVETLKGKGPFTVFAPSDEAFAKLPSGALDDLLKPENKEKLKAVLLMHVVPEDLLIADVKKIVPPTPKTLDETRGSVTAAYQDSLEKAWIQDLRAKYGVPVDRSVLYSIK